MGNAPLSPKSPWSASCTSIFQASSEAISPWLFFSSSTSSTKYAYLKTGDLIKIRRGTLFGVHRFYHFAVYIGDGYVIHLKTVEKDEYCGCPDDVTYIAGNTATACRHCGKSYKYVVVSEPLEAVVKRRKVPVANNLDSENSPLSEDQIITNAKSLLGPVYYNVSLCNCEHFANWCRYGVAVSLQTKDKWQSVKEYKLKITKALKNCFRQ